MIFILHFDMKRSRRVIIIKNGNLLINLKNRYIRKNLGSIIENDTSEMDNLKKELEDSKATILDLKTKLSKYESEEVGITELE